MRVDGAVQDVRAPLARRPAVRFLTVRDSEDPDALAVLRHSSAHLLAEAVRRLYPGVQGRDRARDRQRLLLRLRVPRADRGGATRRDRGRGRGGNSARAAAGCARRSPARRRSGASRPRESPTRSSWSGRPRADLALHPGARRQRGVHRPLPRPAPAGLASDQGLQAHRPRGRVLARRRAQRPADEDLRHGVLQPERPRRLPRAARGGQAARPPAARRAQLDLFHLSERLARARRSGTPRAW